MSDHLPLSALLAQTWVAFTTECDSEFEHYMPHRTTGGGGSAGPWLASIVMWWTCMRFVADDGISADELERLAHTKTNLNGMQRWGYITLEKTAGRGTIIRATSKGRKAQAGWQQLPGAIENRWRKRFGDDEISSLRQALEAVDARVPYALPDCMPILGYGLRTKDRIKMGPPQPRHLPLPALLAHVLLAFAIEYESESVLSLAICANVLRVLGEELTAVRELPALSGVSKEAIAMAMGILDKGRFVAVESAAPGSRGKTVRLTGMGRAARDDFYRLVENIEQRWCTTFGDKTIRQLRSTLDLPLFSGLEPYPESWRASVPKPKTLPHFPMVLHRGGYPDGS